MPIVYDVALKRLQSTKKNFTNTFLHKDKYRPFS